MAAMFSRSCPAACSNLCSRRTHTVLRANPLCKDVVAVRKIIKSQGKVYKIRFLGSGEEVREVDCPDDVYIFDAAEKAGVDLPATCRGGICGACVARVVTGTIDHSDIPDLSFTLEEEEQAKGMALLCMTRPTSDMDIETQCDWGYSLGVGEWQGASGRFTATPDPLMGTAFGTVKDKK
eukprot:CAMPEP_0119102322 /NCGR_PEP_ID=MMETSP1180-20130426/1101_1 /TAXON_ID=3052 ORGANISM="Chlamydomonas cf sp, Strain CCMP681" /NCGR_SAMPLE_ID=MMETSP1180 /ASSEMBLY_ACC=CAM_ASM_000741 /LENGTH=178 /DNA_ID=CAMNT_0007086579 /DNA_START=39 /DNA_END=575 /DNA_ORIENTATION=-